VYEYLLLLYDTEEDNWGDYKCSEPTVKNIYKIPKLQEVFNEFDVVPTYLITHPVATAVDCVSILRSIYAEGLCEIGMHCHPWNTPPYEEVLNQRNSMLCNLPADLQFRKMAWLDQVIRDRFGMEPKCFRAGRWGVDRNVALNLMRFKLQDRLLLLLRIQTGEQTKAQIFPVALQIRFWFNAQRLSRDGDVTDLLEIPATVGFLQGHFEGCAKLWNLLDLNCLKAFHLIGVLNRLQLLNKVPLSPELCDGKTMIRLAEVMLKKECGLINMFFHSTSLLPGLTGFVKDEHDEIAFFDRLREFLEFARDKEIRSIKLSEAINTIGSAVPSRTIYE